MSKKKKKEKDEEGKKPKAAAKARVPASDPAAKPKPRTRSKAAAPRKPKAAAAAKIGFSREEIALRAYFIAEDRHRHGKPGSASDDWHEAERQLRAEAGARASGKTV